MITDRLRERENTSSLNRTLWPRQRVTGSTALYYVLLLVAVGAFLYYLYTYRQEALIYLPILLQGTLITLVISVLSALLAMIFGLIGGLGSLSRFPILRWITQIYVEVIRGTPLLVQILLWYFGIRLVLSNAGFDPHDLVFNAMTVLQNNSLVPDAFDSYFFGVLALSFNYGAYLTEVFRSGILSVEKGQTEAALSLGLDSRQTMRHIILPQAIRAIIPPLTNNFITLIQDSAFLSAIALLELEYRTIGFSLPQRDPNQKMYVFVLGALLYLALCYPLSLLTRYFERRLATGRS